jgi:predicted kinase
MKEQLNFILLNGTSGSGKSTVARLLEKKLKRTAVLEIEDIRCLVSDFKQGELDNLLAWKIIYRMCDEYFKNNVSVLLKQGVSDQNFVNWFLRLAKRHRCVIGFYHLQAPKDVILQRIAERKNAQRNILVKKIAKIDGVKKQKNWSKTNMLKSIEAHEAIHFTNATTIDTSRLKPDEIAAFILADMKID